MLMLLLGGKFMGLALPCENECGPVDGIAVFGRLVWVHCIAILQDVLNAGFEAIDGEARESRELAQISQPVGEVAPGGGLHPGLGVAEGDRRRHSF